MSNRKLQAWLGGLILLTAGCGGGGGGSPTAPPPPPTGNVVEVTVNDNFFDPRSIIIEPGQTVRWVLRGRMTNHTTTARNGEWDSGFVFRQAGATFERTFSQADDDKTFEYLCETHWVSDQMQGSVRVGQDAPPPNPGY